MKGFSVAPAIMLFILILLVSCGRSSDISSSGETGITQDGVSVKVIVKDEQSNPISNAATFIGYRAPANWKCTTDETGECIISSSSLDAGSYAVGAYAKGYRRTSKSVDFGNGMNEVTLYLKKTESPPQEVEIEGVVVKEKSAEGTRSENVYFKLKTGDKEYFIFNDAAENYGFDDFVGKKVKVNGYECFGLAGWQGTQLKGVCVEKIIMV